MKAYTYTIIYLPTNQIYYGVRKSTFNDLGITYFSSSKLVKRLIKEHGLEYFSFKIRKTFDSYEEARLHETKFLQRINAVSNPKFYNQAISSPRLCSKDSEAETKRKKSISKAMKLLWQDPDYRKNQTFNKLSKEERIERGRKGGIAASKSRKVKNKDPLSKPVYTTVFITKNNIIKSIKRNQVPAYKKIGWEKV